MPFFDIVRADRWKYKRRDDACRIPSRLAQSTKILYLCKDFWCYDFIIYGCVMKRESGENPEQTRCCELHESL
jgi:hypothetical protein